MHGSSLLSGTVNLSCYSLLCAIYGHHLKALKGRTAVISSVQAVQQVLLSNFFYRYAYSGEVGDDDEEAQSLIKGTSDGDIGLVRIDRKERNTVHGDTFTLEDDDAAEDKQE